MSLFEIIVVGLACSYCVIAWRDSELFAGAISWLEDDMLVEYGRRWFGEKGKQVGRFFTTLLLCAFCLSAHVSFWCWVAIHLIGITTTSAWSLPFTTLASATVSWAGYAFLSLRRRAPGRVLAQAIKED